MVRYGKPKLLEAIQDSHCVIEASAGTGKTYTLEHLIVQLLLEGVPLDRMLVVTFTKKATLELLTRVRAKLAELLALTQDHARPGEPFWELTPERLELLRAALLSFDRATISTIHGFCQQVLKDAAFEGGRLFQQEAISSEAAFDRAFTSLLRTDYATGQKALLEVALRTLGGLEGLRKLLGDALKEAAGLVLPAFQDARSFLEAFPADLAQAMLDNPKILKLHFPSGHAAISNRLQEVLTRRKAALDSQAPESFWLDAAWLKEKLQKGLGTICIEGLEGEGATLAEALAALANFDAILVAAFLPPLRAELLRVKTAEGLYDFDDMITLVAEALEGPQGAGLVTRLRERFEVALIDEFQDTDQRQWGIFSKLFLDSKAHRLFLVGDPKQAIYGFRGGDLPTYVQALAAVAKATGRPPLQLTENFRSTAGVIRACNELFETTDGVPFFSPANPYRHPVTCGKPGLGLTDAAGQALPSVRTVGVAAGSAGTTLRQTARALAKALQDTLAVGRFHAPGRARPELGPEDVFVLTRTAREGRLMARALKELGLPAVLYRQDGLFDGPEAAACRDLLLAIQSPLDEALRAKALLGPFFGLSFGEAERARALPEGHPILTRLFAWQKLALEGHIGECCSRLVAESGLSQRLLFLDPSQRSLTNLLHILELLQQRALAGHGTLLDLAIQVQRWIDGQDRPAVEDADTQRVERQGGAIQILTMHKAKGLEAAIVVLFGGTGAGKAGAIHRYHEHGQGPRKLWPGPTATAPAAVQAWIGQEEQEEGERLAYVALTRAQAQLILPRFLLGDQLPDSHSNFDAEANPKAGLYRGINRRLNALQGSSAAPRTPAGIQHIPMAESAAPAAPQPAEPWELRLPAAPSRPDFDALRRQGRPAWIFSYSGLQQGLDRLSPESPQEESREPSLPGGPKGGKKLGVQVHAFLQKVDPGSFAGNNLATWSALPGTQALATACHLPLAARADTLRWVHQALTQALPLPGGGSVVLAQSDGFLRELDFLTPYPGRADFLTGSIDLLFQTQGRAYVLDWKTNRLAGYDLSHLEEAVQGSYQLQVKIYTLTTCRFLGITDATQYERLFGGVVYLFLRGLPEGGVWSYRPSWQELRQWQRDLDELNPERLIPVFAGGERHV